MIAAAGFRRRILSRLLTNRFFALLFGSLAASLFSTDRACSEDTHQRLDYFEREVRPVLLDHCQKCHGPAKQESDFRVDFRAALLQGGVSGPAIDLKAPEKSLLLAAIRHEGELKMPPQSKLPEPQLAAITQWVKWGAPWPPETTQPSAANDKARSHWAFQPVRDPAVPVLPHVDPQPAPVDAFLRERLLREKLAYSPAADRRTLIRRVTFDLTGLPPSADEVAAFERNDDPHAYEQLIDRLLASPHYGEQWGRHWLDVARYADTKGYVYAREQRQWVHAWVYRDWVVQALNNDLPYDRFLLLQIAADQAAPEDRSALAAMGFLTLGRRFLGVSRDIIDDRIDVVTRGTMGLTVACARCHDHKYDPIPTRDYYSLYGVFQNSSERIEPVAEPAEKDEAYVQYEAQLIARRQKLNDTLAARRAETAARNRTQIREYLAAQLRLQDFPAEGFDQILAKTDLLPNFVRRWQDYLSEAAERRDPIFVPWHAYAALPVREFAAQTAAVTAKLQAQPAGEIHPAVKALFTTAPTSMAEVATRYGDLLSEVEQQWQAELKRAADGSQPPPTALPDPASESLRQLLYAAAGPCVVPDEPIVNIEYYFDSDTCNEMWRLQNEFDNWLLQSPPALRHSAVLVDRPYGSQAHVFKRGNPLNLGDAVPRQFVGLIAGPERQAFSHGSGRLELAQAIIDPKNPLTARVMVNRVWAYHFGAGLVRTPSDFGTRAPPPSHPELLDWLTSRFMEDGWSLKKLHRRLLLTDAYRQSSAGPAAPDQLASARERDPENRWLWRMNPRRLTFEEMRDSLLAATGRLDLAVGGRAGDLFAPGFTRRTLYGSIDRQFFPSTLRMFDFANPDLHIPQRSDTTVPQQALFFMNHPLMVGHAKALAQRTAAATSDDARLEQMVRLAYQREPTAEQLAAAKELLELSAADADATVPATVAHWQYGYGAFDEKAIQVTGFTRLPHFTGNAWQGGATYPDAKLGWLQLTATGGHPGNDLAHAVVRRWTAPRTMRVKVASTLVHEPEQGQGVRGFLIHSRGALLGQAAVHHGRAELTTEIDVQAGDTLDFVADIGRELSYNQFLWQATITPTAGAAWESERDFAGQGVDRLDRWEQLAQVLLSANEFVFID